MGCPAFFVISGNDFLMYLHVGLTVYIHLRQITRICGQVEIIEFSELVDSAESTEDEDRLILEFLEFSEVIGACPR
jgi:hypothetical protein